MNPSKNPVCKNCGRPKEKHDPYTNTCFYHPISTYRPAAHSETPEDHQTIKEGMERLNEPRLLTKEDGEFLKYQSEPRAEWEKDFDKISPVGNKDDNGYIKEFIASTLASTREEAYRQGYSDATYTPNAHMDKEVAVDIRSSETVRTKAYERGFTDGSEWKKSREEEIRKALTAYRDKVLEEVENVSEIHGYSAGPLEEDSSTELTKKILSAIHQLPLDQPHEK